MKIFKEKRIRVISIVVGLVLSFSLGSYVTADFLISKSEVRDLAAYYELMDELTEFHKKHYEVMEDEECCLQVDYFRILNEATALVYESKTD